MQPIVTDPEPATATPPVVDYAAPTTHRSRLRIPQLRWLIAGMLFLAAILNYIDRQCLSILAPTIQRELNLTDNDYANVANFFMVAYTVALLLSGRLVDKLGPRISMAVFITWWSISNMLTAAARSFLSLGIFRALLGLGEAGNWPGSTKAVSEWFPAKERGIAIGFYTLGATLGATIAPILITHLEGRWHWQAAFFVTGAIGLLWVIPWLWLYRSPQHHPHITDHELALIAPAARAATVDAAGPKESEWGRWAAVFSLRAVWLLMFARLLTDPVWFFYQFWYPKYLFSARGVAQEHLGITWVVYLAADVGSLLGGFLSAWLIKRGRGAAPARMWAMLLCACVTPLSPLIAYAPATWQALGLAMLVVFAHLAWLANISALVIDVIPARFVATAFGVVAAGSAVGAIVMNKLVAFFATNYGYGPWFLTAAGLHLAAWVLLWAGKVHRAQSVQ
jgi:ACS family hexuronate transporter-like MFS transporter